ncbi:putative Pentatricopeptide repeat-containing protein [Zostera marina]|uniref:Putative Pentatricopeptide repeat-containing protein n=1 Tax=Zostera marina TaxID=29655 RepID=A0A0K9PGM0_ZOSMR|nr:putative Pentatricopeptide repeat-containing protein [Zostera marina]
MVLFLLRLSRRPFSPRFQNPRRFFTDNGGNDVTSDSGSVRPECFLGDVHPLEDEYDEQRFQFTSRRQFFTQIRSQADHIFQILQDDAPGVDFKSLLEASTSNIQFSARLVHEVLFRILKSVNGGNKPRCARLAYKFFTWSSERKTYNHTSSTYNLTIKIFSECAELKAMWRLVDEMIGNGLPLTPRAFTLLICTCGQAGMRRNLVIRYLKSKDFNFRPYKNSFNAILHSLVILNQYQLIEWVYKKMVEDNHHPDILTYNIILCAKFRLNKLNEFHQLLDQMNENGVTPDLHTYNILLHVLGKGDKPLAALNLLNYMANTDCPPQVIHFTTLIDGLSRAGNLDACKYFFDAMVEKGCVPDVVCYTVLITGYVVADELQKARDMFDEMIKKGQLPNVFTYNSMIRGLCLEGEFDEAYSLFSEMEAKGCTPNFSVYNTLVGRLRSAGMVSLAQKIINQMAENGQYVHLLARFRGYRRL